jgi:hypothetical protein
MPLGWTACAVIADRAGGHNIVLGRAGHVMAFSNYSTALFRQHQFDSDSDCATRLPRWRRLPHTGNFPDLTICFGEYIQVCLTVDTKPQIDPSATGQLLHGYRLVAASESCEFIDFGRPSTRMHLIWVSIEDPTGHEVSEDILAAQRRRTATTIDETANHRVPAGPTRRLARWRIVRKGDDGISVAVFAIIGR